MCGGVTWRTGCRNSPAPCTFWCMSVSTTISDGRCSAWRVSCRYPWTCGRCGALRWTERGRTTDGGNPWWRMTFSSRTNCRPWCDKLSITSLMSLSNTMLAVMFWNPIRLIINGHNTNLLSYTKKRYTWPDVDTEQFTLRLHIRKRYYMHTQISV